MIHMSQDSAGAFALTPDHLLFSMDVLDTASDSTFDRIARVAATSLKMPVVLIALSDGDGRLFKSVVGRDIADIRALQVLCNHLVGEQDLIEIFDTTRDARCTDNPLVTGPEQIRFCAGAPIRSQDGRRAGTLAVLDCTPRRLTEVEKQLLTDLASLATHELDIRRVAATDPLTGAWNRRMLEQVAHNEFHRSRRLERPFSVAVMDLDHFKSVNDRYGHDAGNDALRAFARTFRTVMRAEDWLFRVGGEEFVALLTGASAKAAFMGIERLRAAIEAREVETPDGPFHITISGAVIEAADSRGRPHASLDTLIRKADMGLYEAKRDGRNRIVAVGQDEELRA